MIANRANPKSSNSTKDLIFSAITTVTVYTYVVCRNDFLSQEPFLMPLPVCIVLLLSQQISIPCLPCSTMPHAAVTADGAAAVPKKPQPVSSIMAK